MMKENNGNESLFYQRWFYYYYSFWKHPTISIIHYKEATSINLKKPRRESWCFLGNHFGKIL